MNPDLFEPTAPVVSHYLEDPSEYEPCVDHLVTEDDTPVDNPFSEKQMRLLVEPLNSNWNPGKPFWAACNVGIYAKPEPDPLVPDMFLSMKVLAPQGDEIHEKKNRCYFTWRFGKAPDLVVEIVSNKKGKELTSKMFDYALMGVTYYVVFDAVRRIQKEPFSTWELHNTEAVIPHDEPVFNDLGLRLVLWKGVYEGTRTTWARWADLNGKIIPTGNELAKEKAKLAEKETKRAERQTKLAERQTKLAERQTKLAERQTKLAEEKSRLAEENAKRADNAEQHVAALIAKLHAMGVEE